MKLFPIFIFFAFFATVSAHAEIETYVLSGDAKEVERLLRANPALTERAIAAFEKIDVDYPQRRANIASMGLKLSPSWYKPVVDWFQDTRYLTSTQRGTITNQISELIRSEADMQKLFLDKMTVKVTVDKQEQKRFQVLPNGESIEFARALIAAGKVPADLPVAIVEGAGEALAKAPTYKTKDITTLDPANFVDWVLNSKPPHSEQFENLEAFRRKLGPSTIPSRDEVTKKMIAFADGGDATLARQLRSTMRNSLVGSREDEYDGKKKQILDINLLDLSDLQAAKMLSRHQDEWTPGGPRGLSDVELVRWRQINDTRVDPKTNQIVSGWENVGYPKQNQVRDEKGLRIDEILGSEFTKAPGGLPGYWRTNELRSESYISKPTKPPNSSPAAGGDACEAGNVAIGKKP